MTGFLHSSKGGGESPRPRLIPRLSWSTTCRAPAERLALMLHDMFAIAFDHIAATSSPARVLRRWNRLTSA
jgi:hypothetical protein